MIVQTAGAVIRLYVGKGELPGHLDQGDLIRERSIGVGIGVALPDGGSYPWEPFNHGLHGVEPLGKHLLQAGESCLFRCLQSRHGSDQSPKSMLFVICRTEAWFSSWRFRFSDSSWLSFSVLCSSCLECSSRFSFKLWTFEESSGFSATSIRALFSSVTWLCIPSSCLWSSASLGVALGSSFCSSTAIITQFRLLPSFSLDYSPPSSAKLLGDFCVGFL
ncbi:hypothetical protein F2Q68_00039472 [Brassica cretica]|uniref:Uncharacterized protein n=1 Tax=Brassica cretica TaxID=69181 RepID=A0A8S9MSZ9_BRACR|nr:hypothetical protein F2Q68_00039472 [Brassica cretica]